MTARTRSPSGVSRAERGWVPRTIHPRRRAASVTASGIVPAAWSRRSVQSRHGRTSARPRAGLMSCSAHQARRITPLQVGLVEIGFSVLLLVGLVTAVV